MTRRDTFPARGNRPWRVGYPVVIRLLVVSGACCLSSVAHARLGDRFHECVALYGKPVRVTQMNNGKWAKFYMHDVAVFASFCEDRCVEVEYLNIPGQSLKSLLDVNRGYGEWRDGKETDEGETILWTRTDGAVAILDLANEPNALLMRSPEASRVGVKWRPWVLSRPGVRLVPY